MPLARAYRTDATTLALMLAGILYALAAGLTWGMIFLGPLMLPDYSAALQSAGRYLAFGLLAIPLAWMDRAGLGGLTRGDWLEALKLSAIGNMLYYLFVASAIQRAGAPLTTMIIGTLPVAIALVSNRRDAARDVAVTWLRLAPSLGLILLGLACVNHDEWRSRPGLDIWRYASGALLATGAVACWTWYALRNADWLRAHPSRHPRVWATAQGLATLPLALVLYGSTWAWLRASGSAFPMPFGPRALQFVAIMVAIGLFASWLGTLCWNQASRRLPTTLAGQLIVFETLAGLGYAFAWRGEAPLPATMFGVACLVAGVVYALRAYAAPHPAVATDGTHPV